MKKLLFSTTLILCVCVAAAAQNEISGFGEARQVRLLQADRASVRQLFRDMASIRLSERLDEFVVADAHVTVAYATGNCDESEFEVWDVPAGKAARVEVVPKFPLHPEDVGIDFAAFTKERVSTGKAEGYVFHNKRQGVAVEVRENKVQRLILFPPSSTRIKSCKTRTAQEFLTKKGWFGKEWLADRGAACDLPANVISISLSAEELSGNMSKEVEVKVTAVEAEGVDLKYGYTLSGGRIVGAGPKVVWDLSTVMPGTYTITAGVDDGRGFLGQPKTAMVVVK